MKATINLECTPEEARTFCGLPDMTRVNELYVEKISDMMSGVTTREQLRDYMTQFSPFGQTAQKFFQQMLEQSGGAGFGLNPRKDT